MITKKVILNAIKLFDINQQKLKFLINHCIVKYLYDAENLFRCKKIF